MRELVEEAAEVEWPGQPFDPNTADGWDRTYCGRHGVLKLVLVPAAGRALAASEVDSELRTGRVGVTTTHLTDSHQMVR
ncbi:hypothetical protein GCM10023346_03890 [Arthrobacter gyeryongensis]|uniref:Uncharacterized protein n=1 Tax=Arthrobacter gyeryongensis TaxID=1650592 RepID=A0ABP9RZ70_9MICC